MIIDNFRDACNKGKDWVNRVLVDDIELIQKEIFQVCEVNYYWI